MQQIIYKYDILHCIESQHWGNFAPVICANHTSNSYFECIKAQLKNLIKNHNISCERYSEKQTQYLKPFADYQFKIQNKKAEHNKNPA